MFADCVAFGVGEFGGELVEIDTVRKRFTIGIVAIKMEFVERDRRIKVVNGENKTTCDCIDFQTDLVRRLGEIVREMGTVPRYEGVREVRDVLDLKFACDGRCPRRVRCIAIRILRL